jgi:hypothetical protein
MAKRYEVKRPVNGLKVGDMVEMDALTGGGLSGAAELKRLLEAGDVVLVKAKPEAPVN